MAPTPCFVKKWSILGVINDPWISRNLEIPGDPGKFGHFWPNFFTKQGGEMSKMAIFDIYRY